MRVLHLNAGNMYGGVETLLVTLARCRSLCPEMEPSFALSFEGRLSKELADTGVPVHSLGEVRASRLWTVVRARRRLRGLLRQHSFDVVVTHMSWSHAIFGPEVRRAGLRLVNWVHGIPSGHWLERWASRIPPDLAICNSQFTQSVVHRLFDHAANAVVYLPVEIAQDGTTSRRTVRERLGAADDIVVILQASRMEALKGHRLHLETLARLKDLRGWQCWMAGGAQRAEERGYARGLQQLAAELGIADRVAFLGDCSNVPALMAAADVLCQPNRDPESFGIVFVEALGVGLPVVTTGIGGALEIVDETCGVLVLPDDSEALAECLRQLIQSPEKRRRLAEAGPSRARQLCDPALRLGTVYQTLKETTSLRTPHGVQPKDEAWRRAGTAGDQT